MQQKQVPLHEPTTIPNARAYQPYKNDSLFEHATWVYAFCREHLFRDDTRRIITALWPEERPAPGTTLIELGCGPGDGVTVTAWTGRPDYRVGERAQTDAAAGACLVACYQQFGGFGINMQ